MGGFRLSVDYGTSHTVAVLAGPDGRTRPLLFDGSPLLPSAVADDGGLLTGAEALRTARVAPASVEPNPKRRVTDGDVLLAGRSRSVADLIAATLRTVFDEAVRVAGERPALTVTHPAGWGAARRGVLAAAVASAGYATATYVPEPVAAARFFTARADVPAGAHLVVYDLGAGTCDVAVLRRTDDGFDVIGVGGLDDVGGLDLDAAVVDVLARTVGGTDEWRRLLDGDNPRERHALWREAREAKEMLSRRSSALVQVLGRDLPVTREDFEEAARPVLDRTVALTTQVIASSGLTGADVTGLYLVGGASRVPLAATLLHRATGVTPTVLDQPELVVAEGAVLGTRSPGPREAPVAPTAEEAPRTPPPVPVVKAAPKPPPPVGASWFDFAPPADRRIESAVLIGVSVLLGVLPIAVLLIPAVEKAVVDELLIGEWGFSQGAAAVAVLSSWLLAGGIETIRPKTGPACRVRVDERGLAVVRDGKTHLYPWTNVKGFATEKGMLVVHVRYPAPGGSGFVPTKRVIGDLAWLRSGARAFSAAVDAHSGGRFPPL